MFKRASMASIIIFTSLLSSNYTFTDEIAQDKPLTTYLADTYLNSNFEKIEPIKPATTPASPDGFFAQIKKELDPQIETLSDREKQEIAFNLVSSMTSFSTTAIEKTNIEKLEIVGGGETANQNLFNKIFDNYINTALGKSHTLFTLCHPSTDITLLRNRQQAITYLNQNAPQTKALNHSLKAIASLEIKSLMPWATKPLVSERILGQSYFNRFLNVKGYANTNTFGLELFANKYAQVPLVPTFALILPLIATKIIKYIAKQSNISYAQATGQFLTELKNSSLQTKFGIVAGQAYACLFAYIIKESLENTNNMHKHLQNMLIADASHIKELKRISTLINKDKQLLQYLPSLQPLADFNNPAKRSTKLNKLLGMLNTNTFKGEASFFSITGRVLAAYELMKQVKDELAPVFVAAGELDMYVALSKLYTNHQEKDARYCIVNFVENSTTPIIDAHNFWNPFINADTVIVNNAFFGASCPNSILTGPNTGGKSTVIKAIMLDVLMAQTFGIAPAKSLTITPFAQLNCFMNISDDIATGASLFKSEVMRAKKLLDMVQGLAADEFSFVIIDEVFTGTSPQEGEMAALRFAKQLGTYKNNISIIATHYPKMVNLETETNGNYRNHHVEILRNEDNSLNRTFKLKNGPSFFNVAFDILEEEGLFI
jgi:hypothetical protein